ncbi:MAG TPA: 6,7-dimethyl-8-ribityllumazine synthase [Flavisolibacter sp.]|jgi:6,7-dimethyl-8-ribityllumazine synthase|nr:6,7-dimethyl-8-ribityllumazine synthase [Flavisolibacter sp.]
MADVANSKLFERIEGIRNVKDALVVLVKTEWNSEIVDSLEKGCKKVLEEYKVSSHTIVVPGAVELPFAIQQCWASNNAPTAFIALGCVVRGDTPHFDYVCQSVTHGITELNLQMQVPTIFGVLTVNTMEQARERIGGIHGHKGEEAALTALKMMVLNQQLKEGKF